MLPNSVLNIIVSICIEINFIAFKNRWHFGDEQNLTFFCENDWNRRIWVNFILYNKSTVKILIVSYYSAIVFNLYNILLKIKGFLDDVTILWHVTYFSSVFALCKNRRTESNEQYWQICRQVKHIHSWLTCLIMHLVSNKEINIRWLIFLFTLASCKSWWIETLNEGRDVNPMLAFY